MKWLIRIFLVSIVLAIVTSCAINIWLAKAAAGRQYSRIAQLPHNKTGLVLGTPKYDTVKGLVLKYYTYRVQAAVEMYNAGKIDYILVSSDNVLGENAETMRRDLIARGIPADRISMDCFGLRTLDAVVRCRELFSADSITIITQKRHGERALFLASHLGLDAIAYVARGDNEKFELGTYLHEQGARLAMFYDLAIGREPAYLEEKPIVK